LNFGPVHDQGTSAHEKITRALFGPWALKLSNHDYYLLAETYPKAIVAQCEIADLKAVVGCEAPHRAI
jgi:hypothetical protein